MLSARGPSLDAAARRRCASACASPTRASAPRTSCCASADIARRRLRRRRARSPALLLRAIAAGAVAARLAAARLRGGRSARASAGLLFEPATPRRSPPSSTRLIGDARAARAPAQRDAPLRAQLAGRASPTSSRRSTRELAGAPPRPPTATPRCAARLARAAADRRRPAHAHRPLATTARRRSRCCWPTAREQGLGAIAVTDHNEISGALEAARAAAEYGVKVIVAEEVKTADQGEVIGLFIEEKIPRGLTLAGDDRRDQAPGRPGLRAAPVRPHARGPRLRAPARRARGRRRDRGLQPARGDQAVQRGGRALRRQVPDRRRRRLGRPRRPGPRLGAHPHARLRRARRSSSSRCATPTSSASRRACSTCRR